jgi:Holliday junction resolvase
MRLNSRVDNNQKEIVDALRQLGCSVLILSRVGFDCPDILVGYKGVNYLIELKRRGGQISTGQWEFKQKWKGQTGIAFSLDECKKIIRFTE